MWLYIHKWTYPLTLIWVAYYDVKVPYIIFSEFSEIYSIQYKPIFLKVENIRTVLLPTVCVTSSPVWGFMQWVTLYLLQTMEFMLQVNYTHNAKVFEFDLLFGLVGKQKSPKRLHISFLWFSWCVNCLQKLGMTSPSLPTGLLLIDAHIVGVLYVQSLHSHIL